MLAKWGATMYTLFTRGQGENICDHDSQDSASVRDRQFIELADRLLLPVPQGGLSSQAVGHSSNPQGHQRHVKQEQILNS
jgi:hypothetical protein